MEKIKNFLSVKSGSGSGYDDGSGSGSGSGYDDGSGSGSGYGFSSGYGIKSVNGKQVHMIDCIPTIIDKIKNNVAIGSILNADLTLSKCFIVKQNDMFAHGETVKQAMDALMDKLFEDMNEADRIDMFWKEFKKDVKYPAMKFFDWHNKLTGSCEMGRKSFAANKGINLDKDEFTVEEFVKLTKNSYGGSVIAKLID